MDRTQDMTAGRPLKLIFRFSLPLIVANIGQQLYQVVDAMIVGQGAGVEALASVGAADWCYWLALWSISAMTQGFAVPIAQHFGNKDDRKVRSAVTASVWLTLAAAGIFTVVCLKISRPLLVLLKTPDDILTGAHSYLSIMYFGLIVVAAYNMASAILRAFGDGRTPLIAIVIAGVMNVALDCLFVLAFRWGVKGAAAASIISQLAAFLYCLFILHKFEIMKLHREDWHVDRAIVLNQCRMGFPLAVQHVLIAVGGICLQSAINLQGLEFIAGYTATNKIYGLLECSATSIGFALTTYTAQNYGANLYGRIRGGLKPAACLPFCFPGAFRL